MKLGYIGLGKMGKGLVLNLADHGHDVVVYNRTAEAYADVMHARVQTAASLPELVERLGEGPRTVWVMVPWRVVDEMVDELAKLLREGDTIIDGGNSPFADSISRAERLKGKGIHFLDMGVSGGPGGARNGACIMVGGEKEVYDRHEPMIKDLCVPGGYGYFGPSGAGHFVKMVHNGIEYGMMQAIAEGFDILKNNQQFDLDIKQIAEVYNRGSVIESRLVGWLKDGLERYGDELADVSGSAAATGEGEWTVNFAKQAGITSEVIRRSLLAREQSQATPTYQGKLVSAMRGMFGGHDIANKG